MTNNHEKVKEQLLTEFTKTIELFGLSTLESRLFAYLYITNEPQTLDDMSEALGKSKTAMSTSIRSLADLNLVSQVWKKGVRKDLYIANTQLFKIFINFYMRKWIDSTMRQEEAIEDLMSQTDVISDDTEEGIELADKLKEILEFHNQLKIAFNDLRIDKK